MANIADLTSILATPGTAWCSVSGVRLVASLEDAGFALVEPPLSVQPSSEGEIESLGFCIHPSRDRTWLGGSLQFMQGALGEGIKVPPFRLIIAGRSETPCGVLTSTGEYEPLLLGPVPCLEPHGPLPAAAQEYRFVWALRDRRCEDFRVERHIWFGACSTETSFTAAEQITISEFVDLALGARVSGKRVSLPLTKAHTVREVSDETTIMSWSNMQVTVSRGALVHKQYVVSRVICDEARRQQMPSIGIAQEVRAPTAK